MGTCASWKNQQQSKPNENRFPYMDPEPELQCQDSHSEAVDSKTNYILTISIQNMQKSIIKRQFEYEEFQKKKPSENSKNHHQMLNLYDSVNNSSNLQVDVELRSLNIQVLDKMYQRSPSLFETEKKQERSFTEGLQYKEKNVNLIQQSEKNKQLIDFVSKSEKDILLLPLPSPPKLQENIEFGIYEAYDSPEITPLATQKQESSCEELQ